MNIVIFAFYHNRFGDQSMICFLWRSQTQFWYQSVLSRLMRTQCGISSPNCTGLICEQHFISSLCLWNEFDFWKVHGIMNTSGLLQSKWRSKGFTLNLQETRSIHDSTKLLKIEFITYMWPAMRFWVQMRYLVEIEILIFSETYMSLEYTCEISVRYLMRFLRNRQKFIGPYVMELYIKCFRRQR